MILWLAITFAFLSIAVQQQQHDLFCWWVENEQCEWLFPVSCIHLCLGGDSCTTGLPNSTLHNIARCAFAEGMWLLMRQSRLVFFFSFTEWDMWKHVNSSWTWFNSVMVPANVCFYSWMTFKKTVNDQSCCWLNSFTMTDWLIIANQ